LNNGLSPGAESVGLKHNEKEKAMLKRIMSANYQNTNYQNADEPKYNELKYNERDTVEQLLENMQNDPTYGELASPDLNDDVIAVSTAKHNHLNPIDVDKQVNYKMVNYELPIISENEESDVNNMTVDSIDNLNSISISEKSVNGIIELTPEDKK
jgi:hypothetical protein